MEFPTLPPDAFPIPGYSRYRITESGVVWSLNYNCTGRAQPMTPRITAVTGYVKVGLTCDDKKLRVTSVHRLVALTFIPNPDNLPEVDHIDGNKENNHVSNLRWCSHAQNLAWARERLGNWSPKGKNGTPFIATPAYGPEIHFKCLADASRHFGARYTTFAPMISRAVKHDWRVKGHLWRRAAPARVTVD